MTESTPAHAAPDDSVVVADQAEGDADASLEVDNADADPNAQVLVSLLSALPGHRFIVPTADGESTITIDANGVLVDRDAVPAIQAAAEINGVTVQVVEQ